MKHFSIILIFLVTCTLQGVVETFHIDISENECVFSEEESTIDDVCSEKIPSKPIKLHELTSLCNSERKEELSLVNAKSYRSPIISITVPPPDLYLID